MFPVCQGCKQFGWPNDRFCQGCGAPLDPEEDASGGPPPVIVEVETGRRFLQNQAAQLRFRVMTCLASPCGVTLSMILYGRGEEVKQPEQEVEQYCRFEGLHDQFLFSFPFRAPIAGDLPVETLRVSVSAPDVPEESYVYELPDRSLFVSVTDPALETSAPGLVIQGGINLSISQLSEFYGTDIKNLLNLQVDQKSAPEAPGLGWQPILLRPAGTEKRVACGFERCGRPIVARGEFVCVGCEKTMCRRHRDDEKPAHCKVCAEEERAKEFDAARGKVGPGARTGEILAALARLTQPGPPFLARIWTERGTRPTTRDLKTVPRDSKGTFRIGEDFTLNVQTDRDGYLTLLDIGTSGTVYQLLEDYPVRAGVPLALSGPDASYRWEVGPPPGVERLKAIVTLQPVSLFPGVGTPGVLGREQRMSEIDARINQAAEILRRMPPDSWTDAGCEFVILGG